MLVCDAVIVINVFAAPEFRWWVFPVAGMAISLFLHWWFGYLAGQAGTRPQPDSGPADQLSRFTNRIWS